MHVSRNKRLIKGSICILKKESEDHHTTSHKHLFPVVSDHIQQSNISDHSLFLHGGIIFSHMVYNGTNYDDDMKAIGMDKSAMEWCKITDPFQQPTDYRKDKGWWTGISLWYNYELPTQPDEDIIRIAYTFPLPIDLLETADEDYFGDIGFWGSAYDLKTMRIFKGTQDVYVYIETLKDSDHSFLLEIIARVMKTEIAPVAMAEVLHTKNDYSVQG